MAGQLSRKGSVHESMTRDATVVIAEVVDQYLMLGSQGMESESGSASLWTQLALQPLQIPAYMTCLVARLISLDSGHCQQALPSMLSELFIRELSKQDRDDFIRWYADWVKHMPTPPAALNQRCAALQGILLNTLHFIGTFYFTSTPKVPRPIYLRWEWARKSEQQQEAEQYVFKMITQESHWTNKHSKDQAEFIRRLIDNCRSGFSRSSITSCLPTAPSLTNHLKVMHSIHYSHLCQLLANGNDPSTGDDNTAQRPTECAEAAVMYVIHLLEKLQISNNAREEQLLPLLTLFCNLATMTPTLSTDALASAYQAIQPFYLWPQPYCEVAKDILDFIFSEQRCPGIHFRRMLVMEQQLDLPGQEDITKVASEYVHILVDKSAPRGEYFAAAFEDQTKDTLQLKRKIVMHIFYSVFGYTSQKDLTELETDLENCFEPDLSQLCYHSLIACEEAAQLSSQEQGRNKLTTRLHHLKDLLAKSRGRQSFHSRSSSELNATVEEVYSVQAKPLLWLPSNRPHDLHVFDGEVSDASGAETLLQTLLTEHQSRRHRNSLPTNKDIKHLRGIFGRAVQHGNESRRSSDGEGVSKSLPPHLGNTGAGGLKDDMKRTASRASYQDESDESLHSYESSVSSGH